MAKKTKTIILDERRTMVFIETIEDSAIRNTVIDLLKSCTFTVVNKAIPPEQEFVDYGLFIFRNLGKNPSEYEYSLRAKYLQWKEDGWIDGYGQPIKNWKSKLNMVIPRLSPVYQNKNNTENLLTKLMNNGIPEFK